MIHKVLCIDIEGGHGGSSKSLLTALKYISPNVVDVTVLCRLGGWIERQYLDLNLKCVVFTEMPRLTPLKNWYLNFFSLLHFLVIVWPKSRPFRFYLLAAADQCDVIHCNHSSLALSMRWLKWKKPKARLVFHIRTMPPKTWLSSFLAAQILSVSDELIFITPNEKTHFEFLVGRSVTGTVLFNPIEKPVYYDEFCKKIDRSKSFKILSLANFSFERGTDRVLHLADNLALRYGDRCHFYVAGDWPKASKFSFSSNRIKKKKCKLDLKAARKNLTFLGHCKSPEKLISQCDLLVKLTRGADPWGRDILEALAGGLPVISIGNYNKFVETNVTGLLVENFDADIIANWIGAVLNDKLLLQKMSKTCRERIEEECDPKEYAKNLQEIWCNAIKTAV